jgi:hypothetical protein
MTRNQRNLILTVFSKTEIITLQLILGVCPHGKLQGSALDNPAKAIKNNTRDISITKNSPSLTNLPNFNAISLKIINPQIEVK